MKMQDKATVDGGVKISIPEGEQTPKQIHTGAYKVDNGHATFRKGSSPGTEPFAQEPVTTLEAWTRDSHPGAGRISKDMAKGVGLQRVE